MRDDCDLKVVIVPKAVIGIYANAPPRGDIVGAFHTHSPLASTSAARALRGGRHWRQLEEPLTDARGWHACETNREGGIRRDDSRARARVSHLRDALPSSVV